MGKKEFSPEKKFKWISSMYFGVADSPSHDVNPFEEMKPFLEATVKQMDWGKDSNSRNSAKERFCDYFLRILNMYDFSIARDEIMKCLRNESMKNKDIVKHLSSVMAFS